ncbi:BrnA antitoxin family protein [Devosia geojensis]|uniref:BrnA antitoxin family protein n=1 Tax=Devosia geojensis TaxID=443610 RepID=UPI001FCCFAF2|nr:BrnA antitoxin family protein [Devosia geojensis]
MKHEPNDDEFEETIGLDEDDAPELTEEALKRSIPAAQFFAERGLPMPGRPKSANPKVSVSLRLDREVVEGFKADGPGWQTRMNAALAESLRKARKSA